MPVPYYGDFAEDDTVNIPFNTFDSNDPSGSVTITALADSDIHVHKDAHVDEIATDGATVVINFDSVTGGHYVTIDTSAHSDYATGSEYAVRIEGADVDGGTINGWIGAFSIERAGGVLATLKTINIANGAVESDLTYIHGTALTETAGQLAAAFIKFFDVATPTGTVDSIPDAVAGAVGGIAIVGSEMVVPDTQKVDVDTFKTKALTVGAAVTIRADVGAAAAPGAANGMFIGGTNAATTIAALTVTNNLLVSGTTTFTGAVALSSTLGIAGLVTLDSLTCTNNFLISGTTVHTGAVTLTGGINAGTISGTLAADLITASSLKADACTKIIDDFETQSQADPTGFHVNLLEVAGTAQTALDLGGTVTEVRLAELDAANLPADIDNIPTTAMRGTDGVSLVIPDVAGTAPTAQEIWDLASALAGLDFGTLLERGYQLLQNKENIVDLTGAVALRTIGDGADMATWGITDDDTTTIRTEAVWA